MNVTPLATTVIGSLPFTDAAEAAQSLTGLDIPAYPQLVKLSFWEDMYWGALRGLPALSVDPGAKTVRAKKHGREEGLAAFYEKFLAGDRDFLALPPEASGGLKAFLARAKADPAFGPDYLKAQVIGPVTFGQTTLMEDGESSLVDDPELLEATALALGGKAGWLAGQIRAAGRAPVVFIDEPGLTSFGSAFSTLTAENVIGAMNSACGAAREGGPVLIGCHVCGNTDWAMMMEMDLDIINFDAHAFMEQFSLYPKELRAFLERGGRVAWGLVPAQGFSRQVKLGDVVAGLKRGWQTLDKKGVPLGLIAERALLSPACGLGSLEPALAVAAMDMLKQAAAELRRDVC